MNRIDRLLLAALLVATTPIEALAQLPSGGDVAGRLAHSDIVRIGNDATIAANDAAGDVTVILGDATIAGRVSHDVVIILGHTEIASTALIEGDLVVVGGSAMIAEGARIRRDLVAVGGRLNVPPSLVPGGDYVVLGPQTFGERFAGVFDWFASGLLWGRPIVPSVGWVWLVVAVFFFVYLVLGLLFERPVREIAETLSARPLTTFAVGFLITLLLGPVCVLLAVSVVGIAVIPLVLMALFAAWMLGKIGTARWIGRSVIGVHEEPRQDAIRSFAVGFVIVCVAYVVPVLGLVTWTLLSVLAVGASALSFIAAYRRESPVFERVRHVVLPVAPATAFAPAATLAGAGDAGFDALPIAPAIVAGFDSGLLSYPKASFRDRLLSGVLDLILLMLLFGFLDPVVNDDWRFAMALSYFVGFWTWKGTTVGGIICQLRIARIDNQPLRFVDALVRGLSAIFSLIVVGLGFLWILRDPERQAWHDRIAGTWVVKVPRNYPLS